MSSAAALAGAVLLTAAALLGSTAVGGVDGSHEEPARARSAALVAPVSPLTTDNALIFTAANDSPPPYAFVRDLAPGERVMVLSYEQWRWLQRWFPDDQWTMARVATCESDFDDGAMGAHGERGRLQIMEMHALARGLDPETLHDPEVNGAVGAELLAARPNAADWAETLDGCEMWSAR